MTVDPIKMAEASEKLGIVGVLVFVLMLVVPAAVWSIRFLYREKAEAEKLRASHAEDCAEDRVRSAKAVGDLKTEIAALGTRLEVQDEAIKQQQDTFTKMHLAALEKVAGIDR